MTTTIIYALLLAAGPAAEPAIATSQPAPAQSVSIQVTPGFERPPALDEARRRFVVRGRGILEPAAW